MQLLQDTFIIENLQVLNEGASTGPMKIKGVFGRCNEKNNNGRIYPTNILENQLSKVQPLIAERRLCGELDHPQNDTVKLSNASHLITKLEMKGDELIGEAELLRTPAGLTAQALINGGVKIGISSRGMGTLSEDREGNKIVNEDFRLVTFDLVADPSTRGAFPGLSESAESRFITDTKNKLEKECNFVTLMEAKLRDAYGINEAFEASDEQEPQQRRRKRLALGNSNAITHALLKRQGGGEGSRNRPSEPAPRKGFLQGTQLDPNVRQQAAGSRGRTVGGVRNALSNWAARKVQRRTELGEVEHEKRMRQLKGGGKETNTPTPAVPRQPRPEPKQAKKPGISDEEKYQRKALGQAAQKKATADVAARAKKDAEGQFGAGVFRDDKAAMHKAIARRERKTGKKVKLTKQQAIDLSHRVYSQMGYSLAEAFGLVSEKFDADHDARRTARRIAASNERVERNEARYNKTGRAPKARERVGPKGEHLPGKRHIK